MTDELHIAKVTALVIGSKDNTPYFDTLAIGLILLLDSSIDSK